MAKPDMGMLLGIKRKAAPQEGPPDMPLDDESSPQGTVDDQVMNDDAPGGGAGGDLTPDMLDYHGGEQACGSCSMFTAPATCSRWPDPVEEAGWCKGWMPQAQGQPDQPDQPNLGPMPGAGGPPGAP